MSCSGTCIVFYYKAHSLFLLIEGRVVPLLLLTQGLVQGRYGTALSQRLDIFFT